MPLALAAGPAFLSGLSGLVTRPALMAAATYGPMVLQAAGQLNNPENDTSGNLGAAAGNLGVGLPGAILGAYLGKRGGRSLAYGFGDRANPSLGRINAGGRWGGTLGGGLGGLALGGVGANIGTGATELLKGDLVSQQIRANERLFGSQIQQQIRAEEALAPLRMQQQQQALRGYADQTLIDQQARALEAYRSALYGVAMRPQSSDNGFSAALAQYAMGGLG